MYIKGHIKTVNTKDQSNTIVYWVWYFVVDTVDTKIKAQNALNAMFVETADTTVKTHPHIPAHNFLNIQPIFNRKKFWKAETEGFSTIPSILYMSILSIQDKDLLTKLPPQTGEQLNPEGFSNSLPSWQGQEATLYRVEYSFHTSLLCIQCWIKATNTSGDSVDKHSIQCIACFDLHVNSVNKQHSIHNSIALILCIDHLDMPFNVHTTDKVTMITVSGFLTI